MTDMYPQLCDHDTWIDDFAAELTNVAYAALLRHGLKGSWIDVELGLWKSLADTIRAWSQ